MRSSLPFTRVDSIPPAPPAASTEDANTTTTTAEAEIGGARGSGYFPSSSSSAETTGRTCPLYITAATHDIKMKNTAPPSVDVKKGAKKTDNSKEELKRRAKNKAKKRIKYSENTKINKKGDTRAERKVVAENACNTASVNAVATGTATDKTTKTTDPLPQALAIHLTTTVNTGAAATTAKELVIDTAKTVDQGGPMLLPSVQGDDDTLKVVTFEIERAVVSHCVGAPAGEG